MASRGIRGRAPEEFSLSFLDVICCGFGAIILLLMITKTAEPQIIEASTINLEGTLVELQQQVFDIRGETKILNRDLNAKQGQLSEHEQRIAILRGQMANVKSRYDSLQVQTSSNAAIAGELAVTKQALNQLIGGILVDKEYVIFIVDTSRSMRDQWPRVIAEVGNVLAIYPTLKEFQVWDADGNSINEETEWIGDSPEARKDTLQDIKRWPSNSKSTPQPALEKAFKDYGRSGLKIAIYVFGDDFEGGSVDKLVKRVDSLNRLDDNGRRMISINAVGIPNTPYVANPHGFAHLMRRLSYKNSGSFVGL
jgi:hypothetical protein